VGGVGYFINISLDAYINLSKSSGAEVLVNTYYHTKEDASELYGFINTDEREVFKKMIGVNGVGPKLAIRILQNIEYKAFVSKICTSDFAGLSKINGLGKKTAEKLVFELKEKFEKAFKPLVSVEAFSAENPVCRTSVSALVSLGIKERDAEDVIRRIFSKNPDIETEDLIKEGLLEIYGK
jgi:Holliday junction DNA helicase RuvA